MRNLQELTKQEVIHFICKGEVTFNSPYIYHIIISNKGSDEREIFFSNIDDCISNNYICCRNSTR